MKFYLSHPIRGEKGDKATADDIQFNNEAAMAIANYIRKHITSDIDIHVPADMETFVYTAYKMGVLNEKQILAVDCKIIENCDAVLVYAPFGNVVSGCKIEVDHAIRCHIPVFIFEDAKIAVEMIAQFVLRS
jgi:hypothetical protein